ncbi:MAG TPA: hypothetical protein VN230_05165 [Burkholderiaceae bacterium]|nr:hypothetical protein [Burkholderiaceae bacterium]
MARAAAGGGGRAHLGGHPPTAHAQVLHEWREPGGTLVYSQMPPRPSDGVLLRSLKLAELPSADQAPAARVATASAPPGDNRAAWKRADARVAAALARVQAAERAVREGQQPRPGERRHLVNGHSRLARAYFDRIASLDAAAARAREALLAAYAERDTLARSR